MSDDWEQNPGSRESLQLEQWLLAHLHKVSIARQDCGRLIQGGSAQEPFGLSSNFKVAIPDTQQQTDTSPA